MTASAPAAGRLSRLLSLLFLALWFALIAAALWRWQMQSWGALVWLAASIATGLIRMPFAQRARDRVVVVDRKTGEERLLLGAMFATMLLLPLGHLATGVFGFADYALPVWATAAGAALQLPVLWLFWRSHADLGRNWSPTLEIRDDHALVTGGVYARIRHPMYAAIWLSAIAQPLLLHNWIAGFLILPAFAAMYVRRLPQEEAMMRRRFGDAYERYAARTPRIWPRLGRLPETAA